MTYRAKLAFATTDISDTHGALAVPAGACVKTYPTIDPGYTIVETPGEPDYEIKVPASFLAAE